MLQILNRILRGLPLRITIKVTYMGPKTESCQLTIYPLRGSAIYNKYFYEVGESDRLVLEKGRYTVYFEAYPKGDLRKYRVEVARGESCKLTSAIPSGAGSYSMVASVKIKNMRIVRRIYR